MQKGDPVTILRRPHCGNIRAFCDVVGDGVYVGCSQDGYHVLSVKRTCGGLTNECGWFREGDFEYKVTHL